jgi:hypothetical protein
MLRATLRQPRTHRLPRSIEAADMRFIVHAEHRREPFECRFVDAIEATLEAWKLLAAGATGVYIFDDTAGKAYWPDDFVELFC